MREIAVRRGPRWWHCARAGDDPAREAEVSTFSRICIGRTNYGEGAMMGLVLEVWLPLLGTT